MLTKTYKVYNSKTLKSLNITGYHLLKDLLNYHNVDVVKYALRNLKKSGSCHLSPLSIDLVK